MLPLIRIIVLFLALIPTGRFLLADEKKPSEAPGNLESQLRKLEKDIARVRELEFKEPVKARIIQRAADADPGIQGYYSLKDKTLYVYNDIKGSYERGVLVHEMVHALQDQHFNLKKLHEKQIEDDAEMALAALIEGDATYTMIELLRNEQPRVAAMLDSPLEKSKNLRNGFLYGQGARYVQALKEKGGWKAVNNAYRFGPGSTAEILFPKEKITTMDLGRGTTAGPLAILSRLVETPQARGAVLALLTGWRGDASIENTNGSIWTIAMANPEQARKLQAILTRDGAVSPGKTTTNLVDGNRVIRLEARDEAGIKRLREEALAPPRLEIYLPTQGRYLSFGEFIDRLMEADAICVGETHDSDLHHKVQLQIIKAIFARDERLGVGMEMFQKPYQQEIDRFFKGDIGEEEFLKTSEYSKRWGFDWNLYRPIVEFCRHNQIPLAGLNFSLELRKRLSDVGHAKLTEEEKKTLGPIDFTVKEHRDYWYDRLAKMHGPAANVPEDRKERTYQVMTAWDEFMGATAAGFQKERNLKRMVILAGSGHIDRWFGIPQRNARHSGNRVATVKIELAREKSNQPEGEAVADYLIRVR